MAHSVTQDTLLRQSIRIGSLHIRAWFQTRADAVLLNELFKGSLSEPVDDDSPIDAELHWQHSFPAESSIKIPHDGLYIARSAANVWHVASETLTSRLELAPPLPRIFLSGHPHNLTDLEWRVHVSVVFNKLLFLMGWLYLHAGAVRMENTASAFVGDKGSGKSTLCLWLGRAGATILSDDHIALHQCVDQADAFFCASGCEQVARVTSQTEAALLPSGLPVEARDFGGVLKKEFAVGEWFPARPYRDVPLQRIFFPHVGTRWQLLPLSARHLTARLLETTNKSHRFADKEDYAQHLDYFSALARSVQGYELELTPDLTELDKLVAFLEA